MVGPDCCVFKFKSEREHLHARGQTSAGVWQRRGSEKAQLTYTGSGRQRGTTGRDC